ncbi:DUF2073 domain-containing protein [Candidatus Woesearchaeota archaeon]|nr:DUF2073 domain-containing protein [Candidatus Woesearchaeota archaeon]
MLTLQFVPYNEIENISSANRVKKLLKIVKENKIVLLEGRLKKQEEAELIKSTMEQIDESFKGIELGVLHQDRKDMPFFNKLKKNLVQLLLGDRQGLTIIGPATIVKEIKQDPDKIQLFTESGLPLKKKK